MADDCVNSCQQTVYLMTCSSLAGVGVRLIACFVGSDSRLSSQTCIHLDECFRREVIALNNGARCSPAEWEGMQLRLIKALSDSEIRSGFRDVRERCWKTRSETTITSDEIWIFCFSCASCISSGT